MTIIYALVENKGMREQYAGKERMFIVDAEPANLKLLERSSGERVFLLRALAAGARDYITKPFDRNELLIRVRNMLDAHLAHRMVLDRKNMLED